MTILATNGRDDSHRMRKVVGNAAEPLEGRFALDPVRALYKSGGRSPFGRSIVTARSTQW